MIKRALLLLLSIFLFASCGKTVANRNKNIDSEIRKEITALNKTLFNSIQKGDISIFESIMSDTLRKIVGDSSQVFFNKIYGYLRHYPYQTLEEFYISSSANIVSIPIITHKSTEYHYTIDYNRISKNTYITFTQTGDEYNSLLTTVFGKVDGEWKLHAIHLGQHSFKGQPAPFYYLKALNAYDSSNIIEAAKNIEIARQLIKPAGNFWHYVKEKDMRMFFEKLGEDFKKKYTLPVTLINIPTLPKVLTIGIEYIEDDFLPIVSYRTSVDIKDVRSLEKENMAMREKIKELFKELYITNDYVLYMAYNELPDGTKMVDRYGFVDTVRH